MEGQFELRHRASRRSGSGVSKAAAQAGSAAPAETLKLRVFAPNIMFLCGCLSSRYPHQGMPQSICQSCRLVLRTRYRQRTLQLQNTRRQKSAGSNNQPLESWYWDTLPPNPRQLAAARWFFEAHHPHKRWTANEWQHQSNSGASSEKLMPEVAFLGRSNSGKSSLLNALLNQPTLNKVGARPGKTKTLHAYGLSATPAGRRVSASHKPSGVGDPKSLVTLLDAPGYGFGSQGDWGEGIIKYLRQRRQLRRVFILINAPHGVHQSDLRMLRLLQEATVSYQVIATKCDRLEPPTQRQEKINRAFEVIQGAVQPHNSSSALTGLGEILAVGWLGDGKSNESVKSADMQGVDAVQWSVLRAVGLDDYVLRQFNQRDQAADYDDTPLQPNAVRRVQELQAPEKKYAPSPPEPLPETAPTSDTSFRDGADNQYEAVAPTRGSSTSGNPPAVTRGIDAFLSAIDKPKSQSRASQQQPAGVAMSSLDRRREAKPAALRDYVKQRLTADEATSQQARLVAPNTQHVDDVDSLHASIEELIAASVKEGVHSDQKEKQKQKLQRPRGRKSKHRNPFA